MSPWEALGWVAVAAVTVFTILMTVACCFALNKIRKDDR